MHHAVDVSQRDISQRNLAELHFVDRGDAVGSLRVATFADEIVDAGAFDELAADVISDRGYFVLMSIAVMR